MQISRLYSNLPNVFLPIAFNYGANSDRLNVVLAEVRKPKSKAWDSHNLGKTTLLHLIDSWQRSDREPGRRMGPH